jgi:hypothetical protein
MATSSTELIPLEISNVTVATGVDSVYSWGTATVSVPLVPTTYTIEGLRIIEVNPTELIIAGATQSTSAEQTIYAGGPAITLPSGKDWAPQTISFGDSLYLGPRLSTDTYPPHVLTSILNSATALGSEPSTTGTSVISVTSIPVLEATTSPIIDSFIESLPVSTITTYSFPSSPSSHSTISKISSAFPSPNLITFTPSGPAPTVSPTLTSLYSYDSGSAMPTGYYVPTGNITTFTGSAGSSDIGSWSFGLGVGLIISLFVRLGFWR